MPNGYGYILTIFWIALWGVIVGLWPAVGRWIVTHIITPKFILRRQRDYWKDHAFALSAQLKRERELRITLRSNAETIEYEPVDKIDPDSEYGRWRARQKWEEHARDGNNYEFDYDIKIKQQ